MQLAKGRRARNCHVPTGAPLKLKLCQLSRDELTSDEGHVILRSSHPLVPRVISYSNIYLHGSQSLRALLVTRGTGSPRSFPARPALHGRPPPPTPRRLSRRVSSAHCEPSGVQSGPERWNAGRSRCQLFSGLSEVLCHIPPPAVPADSQ